MGSANDCEHSHIHCATCYCGSQPEGQPPSYRRDFLERLTDVEKPRPNGIIERLWKQAKATEPSAIKRVESINFNFIKNYSDRQRHEDKRLEKKFTRRYWQQWGDERKLQDLEDLADAEFFDYLRAKQLYYEIYEIREDKENGMHKRRHAACTPKACSAGYEFICPEYGWWRLRPATADEEWARIQSRRRLLGTFKFW